MYVVEFAIDTGAAFPKTQNYGVARRIPHAAREEFNSQLAQIQSEGVIQPSKSPWTSCVFSEGKRLQLMFLC